MPLLFALVSRGTTVLAKYASCAGNFMEVVEQVLSKIPQNNSKLTYSHGSYLFHYINENRIVYLCISDDDFERSRAFQFLSEIKRRFQMTYSDRALTALPYAMNSEFSKVLAAQLDDFNRKKHQSSETPNPDKLDRVQGQVDELRGIMVHNIDNLATRGEKLELLIDKTDDLSANSVSFKKTSRNLQRSMWMKNMKLTIIIAVVVVIVLYLIVSMACGGLAWQKCT